MDRSEKLFQLAVAGSLLILFLPRYAYGQQRLTAWSGLVHESLVPFLEGPHPPIVIPDEFFQESGGGIPWPFIVGLFTSPQQYELITSHSDGGPPDDPDVDWQNELLAYAIWPAHTFGVRFDSYDAPVNGTGTLNLTLQLILPYYVERFPVVIHTIPRSGLNDVDFVLKGLIPNPPPAFQPVPLANVAVPEPTSLLLVVMASLVGSLRLGRILSRRSPEATFIN